MREKGIRSYMQVEIGKIYEGTVKNITKYGAFVELQMPEEEKVMGMVHISEISRSYVNEIRDFVTEGFLHLDFLAMLIQTLKYCCK